MSPKRITLVDTDERILSICKKLKSLREDKGITQAHLANKLGKHRNVITKIESEGVNITLKTLIEIAEVGLDMNLSINITEDMEHNHYEPVIENLSQKS